MKPLNLAWSFFFFAASAILFRLSVYNLMPALLGTGMKAFFAFIISHTIPLSLLILVTFLLIAREGNLRNWRARLRFSALTSRQVLICVGIFLLGFLLTGSLLPTAKYLATTIFPPPVFLPDIVNPIKAIPGKALTTFMGVPLPGAYWVVVVYFIFLTFFNILGEEIWFRGYLLPRQELTWGKNAWVVHGIFWSLFHAPIYPWTILYLLPTALSVAFAAQKFRSTWAGFIVHYLGNGILALVPIIRGVLA